MFLSCHVHVLEWILCSHSYLQSIFVSSNYYPNVMQIVKAKKMYSVMIYFSCYNLSLWFLFDSHFWWIYSFMEIITYLIVASILNWIISFIENDISMKPLIIGLSYVWKLYIQCFTTKSIFFFFRFLWDTLEWKWMNLGNLMLLNKSNINKLLLCKVSL